MWAQRATQIGLSFAAAGVALNTVWGADVEPLFAKVFPQPNVTEITETAVGKILISGVANGLQAMADPACLMAKNLGDTQFTLLARKVVVSVSEAKEKANATGLDPKAADAAYEAELGPDRYRRVAEFKTRLSDPVLKTYWDAAAVRASVNAILGPTHSIGTALQFTGYQDIGRFFNNAFDAPRARAISFASSNGYDAAFKALSAGAREDLLAHFRASDAARIKATNMMRANRLSPQDVADLIVDDLAQHCISKPNR
jgi:hypothetical protein